MFFLFFKLQKYLYLSNFSQTHTLQNFQSARPQDSKSNPVQTISSIICDFSFEDLFFCSSSYPPAPMFLEAVLGGGHRRYRSNGIWFSPFVRVKKCFDVKKKKLEENAQLTHFSGTLRYAFGEKTTQKKVPPMEPRPKTYRTWKINGDSISKSAGFLGSPRLGICRISKHRL